MLVIPGLDALYDRDGVLIADSQRVTVPHDLPAADPQRMRVARGFGVFAPERIDVPPHPARDPRPMLFVGASWPHYGHFIIDAMSRLWALDTQPSDMPLLFVNRAGARFDATSYAATIVSALDIGHRLITVDEPMRFARVIVPEPAIQHAFRVYQALPHPHRAVAHSMSGAWPDERNAFYLSRSRLEEGLRKSRSEAEVEAHAARRGMTVVYPERLSLPEQIAIFNTAPLIAGTIGSAFHTALFSTRGPDLKMLMLSWEKINARYPMIDAVTGARSTYVNVAAIGTKNAADRVVDLDLDVAASIAAIDAALDAGKYDQ